jgi:hypothetical protein
MMAEIHLFGKLRSFTQDSQDGLNPVIRIEPGPGQTVGSLIADLGIPLEEIYTIFLNHKLLATRSGMAVWLGHRQVGADPFDWKLDLPLKTGDRLGLFGRDMAALVI